ncbi:MAG: tRNA lysidine(34) synthetase TilS [Clostridia bacterium]|nr:tRNA lysidine(34) synthetase TilS [Clostridia bacterium]
MILRSIRNTIKDHNLLNEGESVLIGLSGGADSVCLTHILHVLADEIGITLYTAHINHGIRGEEAKRDEQFAYHFSETLGIQCFVKHAEIPKLALKAGESEETVGRRIRYDFFNELCVKYHIDKIATAHNKNDNAETILMHFMRGSSLGGLRGIPYSRDNIIRPILDISRNEIEQYCKRNDLKYVTDSTNLENDYTRNKIRHILIPIIEKNFNPNFVNTVTENAAIIRECDSFIDRYADNIYAAVADNDCVDIKELKLYDMAVRRKIIRRFLKEVYGTNEGISSVYINDILSLADNNSGTSIDLPQNITVKNEYGKIIADTKGNQEIKDFVYEVKTGADIFINEISKKVRIIQAIERKNDKAVYLEAKKDDKIIIRNRRSGDRFYPSGMDGSKKLKQYFIDNKISRKHRDMIPIVEINGVIASVGTRVDRHFLFKNHGIRIEFIDI